MVSNLVVNKVYKNSVTLQLTEFTFDSYYSFLFSNKGQVCLGVGWDLSQNLLSLTTTFNLRDCTKTLINNMCDWKSNWTGDDAKWLDSCSDSTAATIEVFKTEFAPATSDQNLFGGIAINGPGCM